MTSQIEQLFINRFLAKVINCYCRECVEMACGKVVVVPVAPRQIQFADRYIVNCPCEECLHEYVKNTIKIIKFENVTVCVQPIRCYECLEYRILCLEFNQCEAAKAYNKKMSDLICEIAVLGTGLEIARREIVEKDTELKEKNDIVTKISVDLKKKNNDVTEINAKLKKKNDEITRTGAELTKKNYEIVKINAELEGKNDNIAALKNIITDRDSSLKKAKAELKKNTSVRLHGLFNQV